jgi:hypothetical protein
MKHRATLVIFGLMLVLLITIAPAANASTIIRWDIINFTVVNGTPTITAGGKATAIAEDGSKITLTGSGAFFAGSPTGSTLATGGGTWKKFSPTGVLTSQGTYHVTNYISFVVAPGSIPAVVDDQIAERETARSGLAYLRIAYSDGGRGFLIISCHLPVGSSPQTFEGITVSKGFVDYWNRTDPVNGVNANRNTFHVVP